MYRFFISSRWLCWRMLLVALISTVAIVQAQVKDDAVHFASKPSTKVIVGGGIDMPPYEFLDAQGQPAGYNVDLMKAIAEVMGMELEFDLQEWSQTRENLKNRKIDMLEGVFVADTLSREFSFSIPHSTVHHAIFSRKGVPVVNSIEELRGNKVIVHHSSLMHDYIKRKGWDEDLVISDNPADALRGLASGQYDYAVMPLLPGIYLSKELKLTNVIPITTSIMATPYSFAVRMGDIKLLSQLNEGLAIIKQTGRYQEISQKWLGNEDERVNWKQITRYSLFIVGPLLLVLSVFMLWSRTLHRQVAIRTADLEQEIKERKNAEDALRLNQQQLIQADKMAALGVLVSGVAHEINNPNGLILLNVPMLKRALSDIGHILEAYYEEHGDFMMGGIAYTTMRDEIPRIIEDTQNSAMRIKRIVNDLKNFARGSDMSLKEAFDLNTAVQTALRLLDNTIKKSTADFELDLAEHLPQLYGNAQQIEQVIINLVLNACQSLTDHHQRITVKTAYDAKARQITLEVRDQGLGIAAENLSKLTDPFFTTKRDQGGTGLGLSVSLKIVQEHHGSLHFASELGAGTCATLTLPVVNP